MNIQDIKTKGGRTIKDFTIPDNLLKNNPTLVKLILLSESMNEEERQYWFNLTEVMNDEQIEKLQDILTREQQKLVEINEK